MVGHRPKTVTKVLGKTYVTFYRFDYNGIAGAVGS